MSSVSIVMHADPDTVVAFKESGGHTWFTIGESGPGGTVIDLFPGHGTEERIRFAQRLAEAARQWHEALLAQAADSAFSELADPLTA